MRQLLRIEIERLDQRRPRPPAELARCLVERVGGSASIPDTLRNGTAAIKTLRAIVRRVYKKNPQVLAAWETAHRTPRTAPLEKPATNP